MLVHNYLRAVFSSTSSPTCSNFLDILCCCHEKHFLSIQFLFTRHRSIVFIALNTKFWLPHAMSSILQFLVDSFSVKETMSDDGSTFTAVVLQLAVILELFL